MTQAVLFISIIPSEGTEGYGHKHYLEQTLNNVASWFPVLTKNNL